MMQEDISKLTEQAFSLVEDGNLTEAITLYKQICDSRKNDADSWMMLGAINGELGNTEDGIEGLKKAILIEPEFSEAHFSLADLYRKQGNLQAALSHLQKATSIDDDYIEAWMMLGGVHGLLENYEQAESCCRKAISRQADNIVAHMNLANAQVKLGKTEAAIASYEDIVKHDPGQVNIWMMLAKLYRRREQYGKLETAINKALSLQPDLVEAYIVLGDALHEQDKLDKALECFAKVIEIDAGRAYAYARSGAILYAQGNKEKAITYFKQSIQLNPKQPITLFNLALALQETDQYDEAESLYRQAIALKQDYGRAYVNLGVVLRHNKKIPEAIECFRSALQYEPGNASTYHWLGKTLQEVRRFSEAVENYNKAIELDRDDAESCFHLATIRQHEGNYDEALKNFRHAARVKPDHAEAYQGQGTTLIKQGMQDAAVDSFSKALSIKPEYPEALTGLASALLTLQKPDLALDYAMQALEIDSDNVDAGALVALIHEHKGDSEEAYRQLLPFLDQNADKINVVLAFSTICRKLGRDDEAISYMNRLLKNNKQSSSGRRNLHFNLGKLYDGKGAYEQAFEHYRKGNELKGQVFDTERHKLEVDSLIKVYSREFMDQAPRSQVRSDKPVFIVGMPRSGTSLVEQILASHPLVHGAGELPDVIRMVTSMHLILGTDIQYPQCMRSMTQEKLDQLSQQYLSKIDEIAPDAVRVIDKMPGNFMHLGLIELLFPEARVIHCTRNPIDTCLSCYFQDFSRSHQYAYDQTTLGEFHKSYQMAMQHWMNVLRIPVMQIEYEKLVADQETLSRKLVEFCEVDWNNSCLEFHKTKRFVGTASYAQVSEPMYSRSVGRWKNYEEYINPLIEALKN